MRAMKDRLFAVLVTLGLLLGFVRMASASPQGLTLDVHEVPDQVPLDRSTAAQPQGRVIVSNADGSDISIEEWAAMELRFRSPDGLVWEIEKTSQIGVFIVTLTDVGPALNAREWACVHLLPHVADSVGRQTTFTAEASYVPAFGEDKQDDEYWYEDEEESDMSSSSLVVLEGQQETMTTLVGAFFWWFWACVALVVAMIIRLATKPRLPELAPAVDLGDGHGARRIRGAVVVDSSPLSLLPERGHFIVTARGKKDAAVQRFVGLTQIGLVAQRTADGKPGFTLDEQTTKQIVRLNAASPSAKCSAVDAQGNPVEMTSSYVIRLVRGNKDTHRIVKIHLRYVPKRAKSGGRTANGVALRVAK